MRCCRIYSSKTITAGLKPRAPLHGGCGSGNICRADHLMLNNKGGPMQNRYFQIASRLSVVCIIAFANDVIYSKPTHLQDDEITRAIQKFQNLNFRRRADGFYYLVETGLEDKLGGRTYLIPGALSRLFSKFPTRADELKLSLIRLLELENSPNRKYHIALIEEVAKSDPKEISGGGARPNAFPVREEARKVLQSMKADS